MNKKLLSIGYNRKLDKRAAVFNLPAETTCPGATPGCKSCCYAKKTERCYPSALIKRTENLAAAYQPDFETRIIEELLETFPLFNTGKRAINRVRIHESGDFFSQEYVDQWIRIAQKCPHITFLAFTKSLHLDFSNRPGNMVIYASLDPTSPDHCVKAAASKGFRIAYLTLKGSKAPFTGPYYTCQPMAKTKKHHYCGSKCVYCWNNAGDVEWPQH